MNCLGYVTDVTFDIKNYLVVKPLNSDKKENTSPTSIEVDFDTAFDYKCLISSKSEPIVEFDEESLKLITKEEESNWYVPKDIVDGSLLD